MNAERVLRERALQSIIRVCVLQKNNVLYDDEEGGFSSQISSFSLSVNAAHSLSLSCTAQVCSSGTISYFNASLTDLFWIFTASLLRVIFVNMKVWVSLFVLMFVRSTESAQKQDVPGNYSNL